MSPLRRTVQLVLIFAIVTTGLLLALDVSGAIGSSWRTETAESLRWIATPELDDWLLAVVGAGLGLFAIILIAAQLSPEPKGRSRMFEVSRFDDGRTRLAGRAALRAVEHELAAIDGVTAATALMPRPKRVHATIRVDDRCNLDEVIEAARLRLDTPFWINLGLPDIAIEITAEFDPRPPRVR